MPKTKEQLAAQTVQLLHDPDVAKIVAASLSENCKAVNDLFMSRLPFVDPEPESVPAIHNAIERKITTLPKDDREKFAALQRDIAAAGLTRLEVIEAALDQYIPNAPQNVQDAGKECVKKEWGL